MVKNVRIHVSIFRLFLVFIMKIGLLIGLWCLTPLSTIFQLYHGYHGNRNGRLWTKRSG